MRFAFVGLGFAAQGLHLPAVHAIEGAVPVGGADLSPERRTEWDGLGGGPSFESMDQMLERTSPDVVVIATPPHLHADAVVGALAQGVHVLCEKPFVETLEQADRVIAAARDAGRQVAVNHEFRYMPIFAATHRAARSGQFGRPVYLHCTQLMDLAPWDEPVPWRAAMPNRTLFEGGVHLVDLLLAIAGRTPERVSAMTSSGLDPEQVADAIHLVQLDFGQGLLASITIDRLCRGGTRYADLRVDCEDASIRASFGGRALIRLGAKRAERTGARIEFGLEGLAWVEQGTRQRTIARNPRRAATRATTTLYREMITAFERDRPPPCGALEARDALRVVDACYRSARTGQTVELGPSGESPAGQPAAQAADHSA